jgi:two-component system osmolarity sensor histidine kinase EnvZ
LLRQVFVRELSANIKRPVWVDSETLEDLVDIRVQLDGAVMRVLIDRKRTVSTNTHINVVWIGGTAFLLLAVATVFLRNQVRPIERLADAAEAFGKGRDVPDFRPSGAAEVRRAAYAFIDMRERVSRAMQQRTEMLAGVSHDLRTPITRMKLQLALMPDGQDTRELTADVTEMERMVEEYLAFARGAAGETAVELDLSRLLADVAANARRGEDAKGAEGKPVELRVEPDLLLQARPNALKRCVTNLVDNALRHGARVRLSAAEQAGMLEIAVEDDGPGIPPARREEAFRPFHRLDEGRNLGAGGVGLGLAIARDIARGHGGDLTLGDSALGGLKAVISLPV